MTPYAQVQLLSSATKDWSITEILTYLTGQFPGQVSFSSSFGQEDQVLTDMLAQEEINVKIFTLDTGRLFQETYDVFDRTKRKYNLDIQTYYPEADELGKMVTERGPNNFYFSVEDRKECCRIRKIEPLKRALSGTKVWVTGLRSSQSTNRQDLPKFEYDEHFKVIKYNPLLDWDLEEVQTYLDKHNVPQNSLHRKGFISIGCAPCTRAIEPDEDIRAGRWWWEDSHKECGLHK